MAFWHREKQKPRTHTNAPRHWPQVNLDQFDNPDLNLVALGGQLAQLHSPPASTVAFMQDFLYEDGILQVPIVVEEEGAKTCVFAYSTHDKDAAAHFSGARTILRARENAGAVYYAPEALAPTKPGEVLKPIDTPMFSKQDAAPQDASFALWWATPEDPLFSQSADRALLDRWFEATDGYGYVLFTAFVNDLNLTDTKEQIHALPAQPFLQALNAPGNAEMLLHASAAEGLFLAFETTRTAARTRRLLLALLSSFAAQYRAAIARKNIRPRSEEQGLETWRRIRDEALAKEAQGETGLTLHAVSIRDGQPARSPGARTAEDRAAQPKVPTRAELDFAMDLVERVVARMKMRAVVQSSQETLGAPNVFPIIAAKAAGHTWERRLPYEDAQRAEAAGARALEEWPDAELVAVLVDAAIRDAGVTADVLSVRLENRSGVAGDLFQRYRRSASGELELAGNPTVMPAEPFLRPPSGVETPVDPALTALAAQAVDEIVKMLAAAGHGVGSDDESDQPLTSPSALIGGSESRPKLVRFALQGPLTAAMGCAHILETEAADWLVFFADDLVTKDGQPDRRLRLCVQRRRDPATAVFDQHYGPPVEGKRLELRGELVFNHWAPSMFPPAE